ncbi:MAG TPA: hypothetical protein DCS09_05485 [Porphyromonadaceae bacterium]|nr:hypothetical protein [Porphyromonadaceae bacterium]
MPANITLEVLTSVGLSPEQADLYLSLLSHGPQSASGLAKTTHVQRTYIYKVATELIKRGLASQSKKDNATVFAPLSPDHLLTQAEEAKARLSQAQTSLEGILPSLKEQYTNIEDKPTVQVYEGVEGLKKIYLDTLQTAKPIKAVLQTAEVDPTLYTWLTQVYTKERVAKKIPASVIVASGKWSETYQNKSSEELRETVLVSGDKFPFQHEVDVYGTKVAFINYKKGQPLIGVIIDNKNIADTMCAWFDLAWLGALKK